MARATIQKHKRLAAGVGEHHTNTVTHTDTHNKASVSKTDINKDIP